MNARAGHARKRTEGSEEPAEVSLLTQGGVVCPARVRALGVILGIAAALGAFAGWCKRKAPQRDISPLEAFLLVLFVGLSWYCAALLPAPPL